MFFPDQTFGRKNAPPPMNLLPISRVKNAPPFGTHVFQANVTIFELIQDINKTNLLTIFHEDWTINVASRVLFFFKPTGIFIELVQDIIGMNLLTKFYYSHILLLHSHIRKNAPPLGSHVFQAKLTIIELIQEIIGNHLLSKFHEDRKINVASRVLTRKNAPPPGGHVFQPTGIIFKLVQDIEGVHLLTKFHEDQTIIVASRVLTRKNAPPLGSYVFQSNVTIFKLVQNIIKTNLLTKFHEDWTLDVASRELTRQMLRPHNGQRTTDKRRPQKTRAMFKEKFNARTDAQRTQDHDISPAGLWPVELKNLDQNIALSPINKNNVLTTFNDDWEKIVTSRVFTRKTAPPTGGHVFQRTGTTF
ncbi:hypothetical protein DPMN_077678 [Dreissena polymorpha]|uniref:Uncharacterized protein n=1 Tax=Dreissena polymorpha TaxID=45954 RepID=A0A9D3YKX7_DREPO|nr:hypothetical protein DPMN_077678 [Dreissena polymorpha]